LEISRYHSSVALDRPILGATYFKRFRMELDLQLPLPPVPALPRGLEWLPWCDDLLERHALVKFQSFCDEMDGFIFPNLGCHDGCLRLMRDIRRKPGFRPEATWLIVDGETACGTIQGVREHPGCGSIQNVGVHPAYRGRGLGTALLLQAVWGFRRQSYHKATLEVTAQNEAAVRLYHRLGFRRRRTLFKVVEPMDAVAASLPVENEWYL
jgi:ribosomal protein S18 acetylase RimI-like enzyme